MADYSANSFYICAGMTICMFGIQLAVDRMKPFPKKANDKYEKNEKGRFEKKKKIIEKDPEETIELQKKEEPKKEIKKEIIPKKEEPKKEIKKEKKETAEQKTVKNVDSKVEKMKILRDRLLTVGKNDFSNLIVFYGAIVSRLLESLIQSFYLLWLLGFTKDDEITFTNAAGVVETRIVPATLEKDAALEIYTSCMLTGMFLTIMACPIIGYIADSVNFTL